MTPAEYKALAKKPHKYRAKPTTVDGIRFDSMAESKRYLQLKLLERAGEITCITLQPALTISINGIPICKAKADFAYFDGKARVYEDVKGMQTPISKLKLRMVRAQYPAIDWRIIKK